MMDDNTRNFIKMMQDGSNAMTNGSVGLIEGYMKQLPKEDQEKVGKELDGLKGKNAELSSTIANIINKASL